MNQLLMINNQGITILLPSNNCYFMKTKLIFTSTFVIKNLTFFAFFIFINISSATNTVLDSTYCPSSGSFPWHEWITNVQISNPNNSEVYLDHSSFKNGYADFTNQVAVLTKNGANVSVGHRMEVTAGFSWDTYDEYVSAWIDFDQNGIFDASELIFSEPIAAPSIGTLSASEWDTFAIPFDALTGSTTMRVVMQRNEYVTDPCTPFTYGEVEDYSVMIEAADEPIVCDGNIMLSTQAEVNAFGSCSIWDGDLSIIDDGTDQITDLSNLNVLEEVKGDFNLINTKITSLSSLENLKNVEGNVSLIRNTTLTSLNGLENLSTVWGFILEENGQIDNLTSISSLSIDDGNDRGEFTIEKETALVNLVFPTVATSKMEFIKIIENENLESIQIAENSLHFQKTSILIAKNNQLTSITGFPMLNSVEFLTIAENPLLPNLDAFTNVLAVDELTIMDNTGLNNCCGIEPLLASNNFWEAILEGNAQVIASKKS